MRFLLCSLISINFLVLLRYSFFNFFFQLRLFEGERFIVIIINNTIIEKPIFFILNVNYLKMKANYLSNENSLSSFCRKSLYYAVYYRINWILENIMWMLRCCIFQCSIYISCKQDNLFINNTVRSKSYYLTFFLKSFTRALPNKWK